MYTYIYVQIDIYVYKNNDIQKVDIYFKNPKVYASYSVPT